MVREFVHSLVLIHIGGLMGDGDRTQVYHFYSTSIERIFSGHYNKKQNIDFSGGW